MQLKLTASPRRFLQMLLWLRLCAVVGQTLTVALVHATLRVALPVGALAAAIAALGLLVALSAARLRTRLPATQLEIAIQLLLDVAQLTVMLYLSGGTTNPFASLYLIPVGLAAVGLSWRHVVWIALVCTGCYAWLIGHFMALPFMQSDPSAMFDLHMIGMHVTFLLCTALLAAPLAVMASAMRRREQLAAALREQALRHEHLNAMGMLAAGAAHELSTPLFSISMLVSELSAAPQMDRQFHEDLDLLGRQVRLCKQKLTALLQAARHPRAPPTQRAPAQALLQQVLDNWSLIRPAVRLEVDWHALPDSALISVDEGFSLAVTNLLNNAADASAAMGSDHVKLTVAGDARDLRIVIEDEGAGLSEELRARAGKTIFTTKPEGVGLGLVLSHANLNRLHGALTLANRREGGMRTTITLPLVAGLANG